MVQSIESYHHETITRIIDNLIKISSLLEHTKSIYCTAHKGIKENRIADNLVKTASKKARHLSARHIFIYI